MAQKPIKAKRRKISDYRPDPNNANTGTERGEFMLEHSIEQYGLGRSIVAADDDTIPAGNGTIEKAAEMGFTDVIEIETDGNELVVVKRKDWPTVNHEQARGYAYADNRAGEVRLQWDTEQLKRDHDAGIDLSGMFLKDELVEMGVVEQEAVADPGAQVDRAAELLEVWQVERGQVWEVPSRSVPGRCHRVMCADARVSTEVNKLVSGDCSILLSDPPYSSGGFQESQRKSGSIGNRQNVQIAADQLSTRGYISLMSEILAIVQVDTLYLFTDWRMWCWTYDIAERANYPVRNMLVWDKGRMGMGFPWRSTHELILFAKRTPSQMGDGKVGNVLRFDRVPNDKHPTEKPSTVIAHVLNNSVDGAVYDPFLGSGTTLVACEQTGRIGYGMEIEPRYVSVTLQRLKDMGLSPRLDDAQCQV